MPYNKPGAHFKKAQQDIKALNRILRVEKLSARERQIATNIRGELWTALPKHRRPKLK